MIWLFVRDAWLQLSRDRAAQILSFVVPVVFFSIFAAIYNSLGSFDTVSRVRLLVVDESNTDRSRAIVSALQADSSLRVRTVVPKEGPGVAGSPLTRAAAEQIVQRGGAPVALVLPAGVEWTVMSFRPGEQTKALLLYDPADPVAMRVVGGLLQRAAIRAHSGASGDPAAFQAEAMMPLPFDDRAVLGQKRTSPMVSFAAASIAVMFIMFSAAAAGGALIEENENGTLERLLTSGLGMGGLLLAQHVPGFVLMTVCTAMAASAFGLVIATLARTRQQLSGLANLTILGLNALGGSMFPRFLMGESLQQASLVGFNAWALEGYIDVFWREVPLPSLAPELGALLGFTALFLWLARRLARRWETA
jgi:ABC-2 type transport system permease protein